MNDTCPECQTGKLVGVESLRFGELIRCDNCALLLYLDGRGGAHDVAAEDLRLLREWNLCPQHLPAEAVQVVAAIGASLFRDARGGVASIRVPCRAWLENEVVDLALVTFERRAPVKRDAVLASRVVRIDASPFALSRTVREAAESDEPLLFTAGGRFLRLRKHAVFVHEDGVCGRDVALCWRNEIANYQAELDRAPTLGVIDGRIVAVDLTDDALKLFEGGARGA